MPPRTWRILFFAVPDIVFYGITSTYVENTDCIFGSTSRPKDHLHIRGEYCQSLPDTKSQTGSPPHTWRILLGADLKKKDLRITSTYVENTRAGHVQLANHRDHLHIRGEYELRFRLKNTSVGSPPHTWRILVQTAIQLFQVRITSTYVENTVGSIEWPLHSRDHLHIRGEYHDIWSFLLLFLGSPPHTWRIHDCAVSAWTQVRITSTYVENTN